MKESQIDSREPAVGIITTRVACNGHRLESGVIEATADRQSRRLGPLQTRAREWRHESQCRSHVLALRFATRATIQDHGGIAGPLGLHPSVGARRFATCSSQLVPPAVSNPRVKRLEPVPASAHTVAHPLTGKFRMCTLRSLSKSRKRA